MLDVTIPEFNLRIVVHQSVIDDLKAFRQIGNSDIEACGILLGRLYEGAIEVTQYTPPQLSDERTRYSYVRSRTGHLEIATKIWEESNGLVGYVGEWHTHPESQPLPSSKDIIEAKKIAKANLEKLLAIVIGTTSGCIFMVDHKIVTRPICFQL